MFFFFFFDLANVIFKKNLLLFFLLQNTSITWSNNATWPQFTQCFQNTILIWVPCIWLWCCLPFYLFFMYKHCGNPIPYTWINISKNVSSLSLSLSLSLVWYHLWIEKILMLESFNFYLFNFVFYLLLLCFPVGWGCRIHRLHLSRGVRTPPPTSVLDMTLNNLMLWQMWVTSSLPFLPDPLWPEMVLFYQPLRSGQDMTQGQFLSGV